jgi:hypothetical protein
VKCLAATDIERLLRDWRALNSELQGLPLEAVIELLIAALEKRIRWQVVRRIYGRFNRLRMIEELRRMKKACAQS